MRLTILLLISFFFQFGWSAPNQPVDKEHPSNSNYPYSVKKLDLTIKGRSVALYLPLQKQLLQETQFPVLVFGHGQAIDVSGYDLSFQHFAKKGLAVIFPNFDKGFFDQDWPRMADDFNELTAEVLKTYPQLDKNKMIYSGHSKGAYVGLMAAGSTNLKSLGLNPVSLIFFAPAGFDASYLSRIQRKTPLTLIWSDQDTVIKRALVEEIYEKTPIDHKQLIQAASYQDLKADHFFPLSKSFFFGGRNGVSALHFFAFWKWVQGAALDLDSEQPLTNSYLYGKESLDTGDENLKHQLLKKSW